MAADLPWSAFEGKTVLITGATGMLPAYMAETLLCRNENRTGQKTQVIGLARNDKRIAARFSAYKDREDLQFLVQDVAAPIEMEQHVDFIIHAASPASPRHYSADPVGTIRANVLGTQNLLQLAREHGVEGFLFFSSSEVYGLVDAAHIPTSEDWYGFLDPTEIRSCYAESKRTGETLCASWAHQFQVPAKIVRPFHTYGPGMRMDDGRVFADFVRDIVQGRDLVLTSDGAARRAFCYLADAVVAFFTVLLTGRVAWPYNVGNAAAETSVLELANRLVSLVPAKGLKVVRKPGSGPKCCLSSPVPRSCPDLRRILALGWKPTTGIEEGFLRTVRSFE